VNTRNHGNARDNGAPTAALISISTWILAKLHTVLSPSRRPLSIEPTCSKVRDIKLGSILYGVHTHSSTPRRASEGKGLKLTPTLTLWAKELRSFSLSTKACQ